MDVAALTDFLVLVLPDLHRRSPETAHEPEEKYGAAVWEHAGRLWEQLSGRINEHPTVRRAAADLVERPEDPAVRSTFAREIEQLLRADPGLSTEIERLWQQAQAAGVTVITVIDTAERTGAVADTEDTPGTAFPTGPGDRP